jgi:hypothetical protein
VVAFGKPVFAAIITLDVVPREGTSNPQSPTRFPATVEQSGCTAWALAVGVNKDAIATSAQKTPDAAQTSALATALPRLHLQHPVNYHIHQCRGRQRPVYARAAPGAPPRCSHAAEQNC